MIQIFFHDTNIFFLIHIFFEFHNTRQIYVITRNINTAIVTTVSMVSGVKVKNGGRCRWFKAFFFSFSSCSTRSALRDSECFGVLLGPIR